MDPVLRIYLRAEAGQIAVRHYSIDDVAELPQTSVRLNFAACSLSVSGFSTVVTNFEGKDYLTGRFRMLDGDGTPLYIPGLTVKVGDQVISPQYSSSDRYYIFFTPYSEDLDRILISADVSGCSHFEHEEEIPPRASDHGYALLLIVFTGIAAIVLLKLRKK